MKKLSLIILAIVLLVSLNCGSDSTKTVVVNDPTPPPIEEPETPADNGPVKATLLTSTGTKFWDGEKLWTWKSTASQKAQSRIYANGNTLYALTEKGVESDQVLLPVEADLVNVKFPTVNPSMNPAILAASDPVEINLDEAETWVIENISAEDSYNQGLAPKEHSRIWHNGVEFGDWTIREYGCENFITIGSDIYAQMVYNGAWLELTGTRANVHFVNNELAFYNYNTTARTMTINGVDVSFSYNFGFAALIWQKSGSKWYSSNGYTWDGTTFDEGTSAMWDYRQKSNVVIAAGIHHENGEDVLYWVRCDTGYVIRYVPSLNAYSESARLYYGDGTSETGVALKQTLKPTIIEDDLYFIFEASMYKYSFTTGLIALFGDNIAEIMEF